MLESRTQPNAVQRAWLATDLRAADVVAFDGADANKVAQYMLRWESTRGETGSWSETASAMIGA